MCACVRKPLRRKSFSLSSHRSKLSWVGLPEGISVGRTGARFVVKEVGEGGGVLKIDHDLCVVSIFGAG